MDRRMRRTTMAAWGLLTALATSTAAAQDAMAPEPPPPELPWYEAFEIGAFVDAYGSVNWAFPKPQQGDSGLRAYDTSNGFALSWVGLDASYAPDPVGGTVSLRFGPTAETYNGACLHGDQELNPCDTDVGLSFVKQAYASWKPAGPEGTLTLDFGKFDTIYGAEVAESQGNMNYTRGVVYWYAQPLFHTGLRASYQPIEAIGMTALVVNGWNNTIDNNIGKTYGLQMSVGPSEAFSATLGWIGGPEQDDAAQLVCDPGQAYDPAAGNCAPSPGAAGGRNLVDRGGANDFEAWRHLIDLVVSVEPTEQLALVLNADYGMEGVRQRDGSVSDASYYGAMLGARYQLTGSWAIAGRGEYFADPDGHATGIDDAQIATGTLTVEATPTDNLILRLEQRGDFVLDAQGSAQVFQEKLRDQSDMQLTTTLGVVVTTN